jgi:hypothetical protein
VVCVLRPEYYKLLQFRRFLREEETLSGGGMEKRRRRAAHYIYNHGGVTSRRVISHFKRITHKNAPVLTVRRLLKAPLSSRLITPFAFIRRIWTAERERRSHKRTKSRPGSVLMRSARESLSQSTFSSGSLCGILCLQARTPTGVCLGNPHITTDQLVAYQYKLTRNWFAQLERADERERTDGRAQSDLNYG